MVSVALIRSCSLGVMPVVGSRVMSLTDMMPNCIAFAPDCSLMIAPFSSNRMLGIRFYSFECIWDNALTATLFPACSLDA